MQYVWHLSTCSDLTSCGLCGLSADLMSRENARGGCWSCFCQSCPPCGLPQWWGRQVCKIGTCQEERAQLGGFPALLAVMSASTASGHCLQGGDSLLHPWNCHGLSHPLASLPGWHGVASERDQHLPGGRSGRRSFWAVFTVGDGKCEAPKSSQPARLSRPGGCCLPALSLEQRALCNLAPLAPLSLLGCPASFTFFFYLGGPVVCNCSPQVAVISASLSVPSAVAFQTH